MEWGTALKSGAVAGAIYGVFGGAIGLAYLLVMRDEVMQMLQSALSAQGDIPIPVESIYNITLFTSIPSGIIGGILAGLAFGIIFMLLKGEWPGKTPRLQGLFLALVLFVCLGVGEMFSPGNVVGPFFMMRFSFLPSIPFSFVAFLFFGYLTGMFWERFEKKR